MGTGTPNLSSVSTIFGTARAASSVFTVTRTSSEPAPASAITWLTVDMTSAVSVLVIDCTAMGLVPPTFTEPTLTATEQRRGCAAMHFIVARVARVPGRGAGSRPAHNLCHRRYAGFLNG